MAFVVDPERHVDRYLETAERERKMTHISVICGSGYRSNIAGSFLEAAGCENVYSVG